MNCNACGHTDLDLFLDLGLSPIADAYTDTPDEVSPRYPLQVAVCTRCRLVQLLEQIEGSVLFGDGYSFYSSSSPQLSAYHERYAAAVKAKHPQVSRGVLEIGCNDGDLLRHFPGGLGADPSGGPTRAARERGCDVLTAPFTLSLAKSLDRRFGVILANHVLAHVEDVNDTLAGIARLLEPDGVAVVEVQYLPDLLTNNAFDFVYHEHRNYFSLTSLRRAAAVHGLSVVDVELTDRQQGSLRATLSLSGQHTNRVWDTLAAEAWLDDPRVYAGVQGRAERIRTRLQDLVARSGTVAVYGAPAKATTLLNFCGFTATDLPWCVDNTPAKWGRHIPGTGIPITRPHSPTGDPVIDLPDPDAYLLAVWNYARSVIRANPGQTWIVPLPAPVIL